ncbi:MAG TPA: hypothetical protein VIK59_12680 [Verrucomicrobiae bacterium]
MGKFAGKSPAILVSQAGTRMGAGKSFKEVIFDPKTQLEETIRLWQEIYDDNGKLVERHQKYPADTGHQKL